MGVNQQEGERGVSSAGGQRKVLSGEVLPAREPGLPQREPSRDERVALQQGRVRELENEIVRYLGLQALRIAGELEEKSEEVVHEALTRFLAKRDRMTDPREIAFMENFADTLLNQLAKNTLGVNDTAMLNIESIVAERFVKEKEPPTFWQVFIGAA